MSIAASEVGINYPEFRRRHGIDDMLIDAEEANWDAATLPIMMIMNLTVGDKGRLDQLVCYAAVEYLDRVFGRPPESASIDDRLRALVEIVVQPGRTEGAFRRWMQSWYG